MEQLTTETEAGASVAEDLDVSETRYRSRFLY
jgi:hypothetical protein